MNSRQQEGFAHDSVLVGFEGEGAQYLDDRWPCLRQEGQQNNPGCEAAQGVPVTKIVEKRGIKPLSTTFPQDDYVNTDWPFQESFINSNLSIIEDCKWQFRKTMSPEQGDD